MLNDGWDEGMTVAESDETAESIWNDAHPACISCGQPGCLEQDCPSAACDIPHLKIHHREPVHETCVEAFDRHISNRCTGDVCNCGAPVHVEEQATVSIPVESMQALVFGHPAPRKREAGALVRLAVALGLFVGLQACAAHAPAPEVETVGQLAAGPSVYAAPVHHDAPPALGFVAGSDSDDVSSTVTTTTRVTGEPDAAPEIVDKGGGLVAGEAR